MITGRNAARETRDNMCNESSDGAPRRGAGVGGWFRFACTVCGGPFEADRETSIEECSADCEEEALRRMRITRARERVTMIPVHDDNVRARASILAQLDALYEDDHIDAHREAAALDDAAKLRACSRIVLGLQALVSTELDPRVFEGLNELSEVLANIEDPDTGAIQLLREYAEHHGALAKEQEPGSIDDRVAFFLRAHS
jgi:hypothetical protein